MTDIEVECLLNRRVGLVLTAERALGAADDASRRCLIVFAAEILGVEPDDCRPALEGETGPERRASLIAVAREGRPTPEIAARLAKGGSHSLLQERLDVLGCYDRIEGLG